jgi:LysR family transcriptional regulator of gallate degradation
LWSSDRQLAIFIPGDRLSMDAAPTISLRYLRAFIAVADAGSITGAALATNRAESAISRSVKQLETVLGADFFDRAKSGMTLTTYGRALLARARAVAAEFAQARAELAHETANPSAPVFEMLYSEHRLLIFIALAETRHMPTAAKRFGVSQPAVSTAIGDLEDSLGFPLFRRTPKGMLLTREGEILLFRTKRAVAELRHAEADIAALQGNLVGEVVVGSHPLSRASILPLAIAKVLAAHPHLTIITNEGPSDNLIAGVRRGDCDFILNTSRAGRASLDLVEDPLMTERLVVFARDGHPLTRRKTNALDDLLQAGWILPARRTPTREMLDNSFRQLCGRAPKSAVETSDLLVLRGLLLGSDLLTAVSPQQLAIETRMGLVQPLAFELPQTTRIIVLMQRARSTPSPGARLLIAAIREVVAEMGNSR